MAPAAAATRVCGGAAARRARCRGSTAAAAPPARHNAPLHAGPCRRRRACFAAAAAAEAAAALADDAAALGGAAAASADATAAAGAAADAALSGAADMALSASDILAPGAPASPPWAWDAVSDAVARLGVDTSGAVDVLAAEQADGFSLFSGVPLADAVLPLLSLAYATAAPGVLWGAIDTYLLAPAASVLSPRIDGDDVRLIRRIGEGTFGSVYSGTYRDGQAIIGKKAKTGVEGAEIVQDAEEYFNGRLMRSAATRKSCAPYLGSYSLGGPPILVWKDEGQETLADLLEERDCVGALEQAFGLRAGGQDETARANQVTKVVLRQLLTCLKALHDDGIVHRDIKPANIVVANGGRLRIIDFGAAADMRTGINYEPKRGMLDPNYSPPEQYVMPESTPAPPAAPIAAILSPFLWAALRPDLFDTYSAGLILLQLAVPALRRRNSLGPAGTFQRSLAESGNDLRKWRSETATSVFDLEVLDHSGGLAFDLACCLVRPRNAARRGRLSAAQALLHPWLLL